MTMSPRAIDEKELREMPRMPALAPGEPGATLTTTSPRSTPRDCAWYKPV
jgi:hypothetical protein